MVLIQRLMGYVLMLEQPGSNENQLLGWGIFILLFILFLAISYIRQNIRERSSQKWAEGMGFYRVDITSDWVNHDSIWFRKGSGATNIFHRMIGDMDVTIFDYEYSESEGYGRSRKTKTYRHTLVLLTLIGNAPNWPRFSVRRSYLDDPLKRDKGLMVGREEDIDWFSRHYRIDNADADMASLPMMRCSALGVLPLVQFLKEHNGLEVVSKGYQIMIDWPGRAGGLRRLLPAVCPGIAVGSGGHPGVSVCHRWQRDRPRLYHLDDQPAVRQTRAAHHLVGRQGAQRAFVGTDPSGTPGPTPRSSAAQRAGHLSGRWGMRWHRTTSRVADDGNALCLPHRQK